MAKRISKDDLDRFHDYGIYAPSRTIYVGSEIVGEDEESGVDALMAERVIKNLFVLDSLSEEPITIILNNIGGDVNHGLAIFDAVQQCRSHITIKVFGSAMSMGSIILQAGDERVMAPNAVQMIHYGSVAVAGESKSVYRTTEEAKRVDKWMEQMYLDKIKEKNPKFPASRLQKMLGHDTYLTARQSVELGLADKVLGDE